VPCLTTISEALALLKALEIKEEELGVQPL
jgi:hypothetical protein